FVFRCPFLFSGIRADAACYRFVAHAYGDMHGVDETLIFCFVSSLRWSCDELLIPVGYPPSELSDTRKLSHSMRRSMRLIISKLWMVRHIHEMHKADWICSPSCDREAKTRCFVKQS